MAKFLNTDLLNEWIPRLIQETERELVIIVPYIKTSERIFTHLLEANKRGVETTLVYRENKLTHYEKSKLASLDNLNLFHHPNVHAKFYYNGNYMIIGSMNLYEFSELNNREMGILIHKDNLENSNKGFGHGGDHPTIFEDAIKEINLIIRSSNLERKSRETIEEGFEMEIIKTQKEKTEEYCRELNKVYLYKKFEAVQVGNEWKCVSTNYSDRIDLTLEGRASLSFQYDEKRIESIFRRIYPHYHEFKFDGYKFYWGHHKSQITLYKNNKHKMWNNLTPTQELELMKNGIDQLISFLRPFI